MARHHHRPNKPTTTHIVLCDLHVKFMLLMVVGVGVGVSVVLVAVAVALHVNERQLQMQHCARCKRLPWHGRIVMSC